MKDRFFSEGVQFQAVLSNLEKNNGQLRCALCHRSLTSKAECHFDHIVAYAKGGKSTLDNCQILCVDCNLSKSDKELHDFLLEEKARKFMSGEAIDVDSTTPLQPVLAETKMTKEQFDVVVGAFIAKHGTIRKVDFTRDKNGLPSITYVVAYYGSMNGLKRSFGLEIDTVWDRESIWTALEEYAKVNPSFRQADLTKKNGLPSLPCILSHYPEYENFSDIRTALGLKLNYELWTKERVVSACRKYLETHSSITQRDLTRENGLPTAKVIYGFFGTMQDFQRAVGSKVSKVPEFISRDEIMRVVREVIQQNGSVFESRTAFMKKFPYSESVIIDRFGSFDAFISAANITIKHRKKAKYTKKDVDDCILAYLKSGQAIPTAAKQLSALKLPSSATILRFYDDWKEPFLVFAKMISLTGK